MSHDLKFEIILKENERYIIIYTSYKISRNESSKNRIFDIQIVYFYICRPQGQYEKLKLPIQTRSKLKRESYHNYTKNGDKDKIAGNINRGKSRGDDVVYVKSVAIVSQLYDTRLERCQLSHQLM